MNLFKKIKLKLIEIGLNNLIKLSLLLDFPVLTSFLFNLAAGSVGHGRYTVLCLGRSIFTDDIKALVTYSGQIKYRILHLRYLDMLLNWFIPSVERRELAENNYHVSKVGEPGRQKCYTYLTRMLPSLLKFMGFQAVISGNFGYIQQQELARVCQDQAVPFIVLHKEGMGAPVDKNHREKLYVNYRLLADRILVYNEPIKDLLLSLNIPGLTVEKVEVVGIPRLDYYFKIKKPPLEKQVVFFSYIPFDKFIPLIKDDKKFEQAVDRTHQFFIHVYNFAAAHPEIKIILKSKAAQHYLDYAINIFKENFSAPLSNLEITNTGDPTELILRSMAVIGFHSTTLIEALVLDKIIISPYYEDLITDSEGSHFGHYPGLIYFVRSYADLEAAIFSKIPKADGNVSLKNEFLRKWIFLPDGAASQRVEKNIINLIKKNN